MPEAHRSRTLALAAVLVVASCSHTRGPHVDSATLRSWREQAAAGGAITFEEDFREAQRVYEALPKGAPERAPLRARLVAYLLGPVAPLTAVSLRAEASAGGGDDVPVRIFQSFKDALDLFEPDDLRPEVFRPTVEERRLLDHAARVLLDIFAARGAEAETATTLAVLASLDPASADWPRRLDEVLVYAGNAASEQGGAPAAGPRGATTLQKVVAFWPAPLPIERLRGVYQQQHQAFVRLVERPEGSPGAAGKPDAARRSFGDLLLRGEELQRALAGLAALHLLTGDLTALRTTLQGAAGHPGDDADLRRLCDAVTTRNDAPAWVALVNRFLPQARGPGPAKDEAAVSIDLRAATRMVDMAAERFPDDADVLHMAAKIARMRLAPFLWLRRLEEAAGALGRRGAPAAARLAVHKDLAEAYRARMRYRSDPERVAPAQEEAAPLLRWLEETSRAHSGADLGVTAATIHLDLAVNHVNAGEPVKAEALFTKAIDLGASKIAVASELATIALKRGDATRAAQIADDAIAALPDDENTIDAVERRASLEALAGDARDVMGDGRAAQRHWTNAARGFDRLMVEFVQRHIAPLAAETLVESGRLLYKLGRRREALSRFMGALDQAPDRDGTYSDSIAFLVQRGEVDAALAIFRRLIAQPDSAISEYVKVYASLWILDITRRTSRVADRSAETYLRTLPLRHGELRPLRTSPWYRTLARFALGEVTYDNLSKAANSPGKRAETCFYESMRRLAEGRTDDAHALWLKVLETNMVSFFEFDMAQRYLRAGAPASPPPDEASPVPPIETI